MNQQPSVEMMEQVARQCSAVRHLAVVLAQLHGDYACMFAAGHHEKIADLFGHRTAAMMETLGDILNGMDAVEEGDDWLDPIFEEAHRRWPTKGCPHCGHLQTSPEPNQTAVP